MNSNNALLMHNMNHTKTVEKSVDFVKEVELEGTVNAVCKPKVFGNSTQETRSGKNLFKLNDSQTKNGVTVTNNGDGTITLNGTATTNMDMWIANGTSSNPIKRALTTGTTLTQKLNHISGTCSRNPSLGTTMIRDGSLKWQVILSYNETVTYTSAQDEELGATELYIPSGSTFNNYTIFPQLEFGTVATTPEMYGASPSPDFPSPILSTGDEGSVELNAMGKNLANVKSDWRTLQWNNGFTYSTTDTSITVTNPNTLEGSHLGIYQPYNLQPGTYTIQIGNIVGDYNPRVRLLSNSGTNVNILLKANTFETFSIDEPTVIWVILYTNLETKIQEPIIVTFNEIMICKGELTPYQSYRSNTIQFPLAEPLRKIGDVADYIDWENKVVVRNVDKIVLDENKSWNMGSRQFEQCATFYTDTKGTTFRPQKLCNYFPFIDQAYNNNMDVECITNNVNSGLQMILLQIKKSRLEQVNGFGLKDWLKEHNVVIYEELATPIEQPFTAEQLAVAELMTTQKNCTISVITETEPSKTEVKYLKMGVK